MLAILLLYVLCCARINHLTNASSFLAFVQSRGVVVAPERDREHVKGSAQNTPRQGHKTRKSPSVVPTSALLSALSLQLATNSDPVPTLSLDGDAKESKAPATTATGEPVSPRRREPTLVSAPQQAPSHARNPSAAMSLALPPGAVQASDSGSGETKSDPQAAATAVAPTVSLPLSRPSSLARTGSVIIPLKRPPSVPVTGLPTQRTGPGHSRGHSRTHSFALAHGHTHVHQPAITRIQMRGPSLSDRFLRGLERFARNYGFFLLPPLFLLMGLLYFSILAVVFLVALCLSLLLSPRRLLAIWPAVFVYSQVCCCCHDCC